jgi:hypothetical protein
VEASPTPAIRHRFAAPRTDDARGTSRGRARDGRGREIMEMRRKSGLARQARR